jgi:hypothetical protein
MYGGAECYSGMEPEADMGIEALNCAQSVYLVTSVFNPPPVEYWDDYYGLVEADTIKAQSTSYVFFNGLPYPYWTGYKRSDCYDDAVVNAIPGGARC